MCGFGLLSVSLEMKNGMEPHDSSQAVSASLGKILKNVYPWILTQTSESQLQDPEPRESLFSFY